MRQTLSSALAISPSVEQLALGTPRCGTRMRAPPARRSSRSHTSSARRRRREAWARARPGGSPPRPTPRSTERGTKLMRSPSSRAHAEEAETPWRRPRAPRAPEARAPPRLPPSAPARRRRDRSGSSVTICCRSTVRSTAPIWSRSRAASSKRSAAAATCISRAETVDELRRSARAGTARYLARAPRMPLRPRDRSTGRGSASSRTRCRADRDARSP